MLSFRRMRLLDRYAGGMLCGFFDITSKVIRRLRGRRESCPVEIKRILITKYFGMGSLILASPMVRSLRNRYPSAQIDLLTIEQNRALTEILQIFDRSYVVDTRSLSAVAKSMTAAMRQIRKQRYDVVIDAEFFSRLSILVAFFSGARYSVGFYLPEIWRGNFLTHRVHFNPYRHAILGFMALAKALGAESDNFEVERVQVTAAADERVQAYLQEQGFRTDQRIISVNVNTGPLSPERRWPEDHFVSLIKSVLWHYRHVVIVLVGGPSDAPLVSELHSRLSDDERKRTLNVAGIFNLPQFCGLLKRSTLFISNDSGPLHLAESLRIPTISFFGPETPLLYGPTGDKQLVFYKGIYCSPCLNIQNQKEAPCNGNNICMQSIRAEEVFSAVKMLLDGVPVASPFRLSFDGPANELLMDYRCADFVQITTPKLPVRAIPRRAGHL
jgi:ADP-heptose:LPS heptosyltransferase